MYYMHTHINTDMRMYPVMLSRHVHACMVFLYVNSSTYIYILCMQELYDRYVKGTNTLLDCQVFLTH